MYLELDTTEIADAQALFIHYLESARAVDFTVFRKADTYKIRITRMDCAEAIAIRDETNHESPHAVRQHAA